MKWLGIAVGVVAAIALAWWALGGGGATAGQGAGSSTIRRPMLGTPAAGGAGGHAGADPVPKAPPSHATRLGGAEGRKRVAARIAEARAARADGQAPKLADDDGAKVGLDDAMREVHAQLLGCYLSALPSLARKDFTLKAELVLTGAPDVGTLIEPKDLVDDQGQRIDPKLDICLRAAFQNLELPPLAEGSEMTVTYPFEFAEH